MDKTGSYFEDSIYQMYFFPIFSDVHMNCIIKLMTNSIFTGFHLSGEVSPGEGSAGDQERMKVSVSFDR